MTLHPQTPWGREGEGIGCPITFSLPWNTTRTLADAWSEIKAHRDDANVGPHQPSKTRMGRPKGILVSPKHAFAGREE